MKFFYYFGLNVKSTNDFYSPIPDLKALEKAQETFWTEPSDMIGVDLQEKSQLQLLSQFKEKYKQEYDTFPLHPTNKPTDFYLLNGSFENVDPQIYYSLIRNLKPKHIIEVGSGNSTLLAAQAIRRNKE